MSLTRFITRVENNFVSANHASSNENQSENESEPEEVLKVSQLLGRYRELRKNPSSPRELGKTETFCASVAGGIVRLLRMDIHQETATFVFFPPFFSVFCLENKLSPLQILFIGI